MKTKRIREMLMVSKWLRKNKPKQCPDSFGVPLSNLTVVPKSVRYNGVEI